MLMKIAIVHSRYSSGAASGENVVVRNHLTSLHNLGHEVELFEYETPSSFNSIIFKLQSAITVSFGISGANPTRRIKQFGPDVIFLHNIFPNISERWLKSIDIPIVRFVHNFRTLCAIGTFYRDNSSCYDCLTISLWSSLKNKCYKNSFFATLPVFFSIVRTKIGNRPLINSPEMTLVLSKKAVTLVESHERGVRNVKVLHNFVDELPPTERLQPELGKRWVIISRLEPEKGIEELLNVLPMNIGLDIIGDGSLLPILKSKYRLSRDIRFLGKLNQSEIFETLSSYTGAFFSSKWLEGAPMTLIEFLRAGIPTISITNNVEIPGLMPELTLTWGEVDLRNKLNSLVSQVQDHTQREILSNQATKAYLHSFNVTAWQTTLMKYLNSLDFNAANT